MRGTESSMACFIITRTSASVEAYENLRFALPGLSGPPESMMVMLSVWQSGESIALVVRLKQLASYSYSDQGTNITSFEEHTVEKHETLKCGK